MSWWKGQMRLLDWRGGDDATPGGFRSSTDETSAEAAPLVVDVASTVRTVEFPGSAEGFRAGRLKAVRRSGRISLAVRDSNPCQLQQRL